MTLARQLTYRSNERDSKTCRQLDSTPAILPTCRVRNCRDAREKRLEIRLQRRPVNFGEPEDRLQIEIDAQIDRRIIAAHDPNSR
jgi:hypothetical protein